MKGDLSIKKISAKTGRSGYHLINNKPTAHVLVQEFITKLCSTQSKPCWFWILICNPIAWRLFRQVSAAAQIGLRGTYFRSRRFAKDAPIPSSKDLGPPPLEKQGEGRYTEGRDVVLYLSRNIETAAIESGPNKSKPKIFIQRFDLGIPEIKVLRLAEDLEEKYPHLHYLLLDSEYLPEETWFAPVSYRATQFVAYLCRLKGVLAVEYPSVRGEYKSNPEAVNLVLFGKAADMAKDMTSGDPIEYHPSYE